MSSQDKVKIYVNTLNKYGINSKEATGIFEVHKSDAEFIRIITVAGWINSIKKEPSNDEKNNSS